MLREATERLLWMKMMEEDRPGPLAVAEGWTFTQSNAHVQGLKDSEGQEYEDARKESKGILIEIWETEKGSFEEVTFNSKLEGERQG